MTRTLTIDELMDKDRRQQATIRRLELQLAVIYDLAGEELARIERYGGEAQFATRVQRLAEDKGER